MGAYTKVNPKKQDKTRTPQLPAGVYWNQRVPMGARDAPQTRPCARTCLYKSDPTLAQEQLCIVPPRLQGKKAMASLLCRRALSRLAFATICQNHCAPWRSANFPRWTLS